MAENKTVDQIEVSEQQATSKSVEAKSYLETVLNFDRKKITEFLTIDKLGMEAGDVKAEKISEDLKKPEL